MSGDQLKLLTLQAIVDAIQGESLREEADRSRASMQKHRQVMLQLFDENEALRHHQEIAILEAARARTLIGQLLDRFAA